MFESVMISEEDMIKSVQEECGKDVHPAAGIYNRCSTQAVHTCSDSRLEGKKLQELLRFDHRPEISTSTSYWRAFPDLLADYVGDVEKEDDVSSVFYRA